MTGRAVMSREQARGGERMSVESFYEKDSEFKSWLGDNPDGYVLNCYKTGKVHTALCPSYQSAGPRMTYTRPKACSTSIRQLFKYAAQNGIDTRRCELCF
jgi:hypothetical protein